MNRQFRRRVEREWNKIKLGASCTKFIEQNNLFTIPYVIYFQVVKVSDDLMCVYNVGLFQFRDGSGFAKRVTICHYVNNLFRSLGSVELGFTPENELEEGDELDA
ncbi:MAG: hypothetical protein ACBZ72_00370 [Candidatus Bathyarchaeia archaeon]|jgi:hypothetical protein